jgi:hypothetical protein
MTLSEFRREMDAYREAANSEAAARKDSYIALEKLHALYEKFDADERLLADRVLAEWALSDNEGVRFDALALIDDFKIAAAAPALHELAQRLAASTAPSAPYELKKVARITKGLVNT